MGTGMGFIGKAAGQGSGARAVRFGLVGLILFVVAACSTIYRNNGYVPSEQELAAVALGDTRDVVGQKIGRPTAAGLLNDTNWFYVQSRWAYRGALAPKEIERQVVSITFDTNGNVSNIERFGLERGKVVALSRRVTETNIKGIGFIRQLLGSFGRLGPSAITGQ